MTKIILIFFVFVVEFQWLSLTTHHTKCLQMKIAQSSSNIYKCMFSNDQTPFMNDMMKQSHILFIPNQPMHSIYQFIKATMNLSEEIISLCQQNIQNGTQKSMDQLTFLFTNPLEYINVMSVISDPYVGFMYCLIIKGHVNKAKRSSVGRQTLSCVKGTQSEQNFLILKEVSQKTNFYQILEAKYKEQHTKKSNQEFVSGQNNQSDHNQLNDEQFSKLWYESLYFMDVLLASKSTTFSTSQCLNGVLKGQKSLFEELFAKLITIIFLELPSLASKQQLFQSIIKNIAFTGQSETKSSKISLLNIIYEITKYLMDQEEPSRIKYVIKTFGWKMINLTMTQFKQSLMSYHEKFDLVQKGIEIINQFYNLVSIPSFGNKISKGQALFSLQARRVQKATENNQQNQLRTDTILCLGSIFQSMPWEYLQHLFITCLEIFQKITLGTAFNDGLSIFQQSLSFVTQMMIKRWIEKVKKYGLDQDTSRGDFYTQSIMIGILSNLFNSNISIALENNKLLIIILDQFCLEIVRLIPITVSEGEKSPLCSLFYFLVELYKNFKSINICNREIDILSKIQRVAEQFLIKSTSNQYISQYPDFKDEIQVSSQFFTPYFQLIEQIYFNQTDEILDNFFQKIQQVVLNYTASYNGPKTVGTLVIQLVKSIDESSRQEVFFRKFELFFFLFKQLKKINNIHYLKLLDEISMETIMSLQDEIAGKQSDLNNYINRKTLYTFETFFANIVSQIVDFLYTCENPYLTSYNMHILTQLCGRLKNLERSGRSKTNFNKLISTSRYLQPIENFVEKMNFTNLQNIENHSQRVKVFELIALVGVSNMQKVYWLYELVQRNLQALNHDSLLRFVVDTTGILNKKGRLDLQQAIIQLVFSDLNNNQSILNCFDETNLKNDTYFMLYSQFLSKIVSKMQLHSMKNDQLAARFQTIFFSRFNILHKLYDQQNCKTIHELWISYSKISKLYGYFPAIPSIIYTCQLSSQLVQILFNRLHCLSSIQDVVSLYLNVFQRKRINFEEYVAEDSRKQLTGLNELPKYLHILADYIDIKGIEIFFDYKTIIKSIFIGLYRNYKQCNSSAATLDSFGLDDQYEQASGNSTVNYLEDFYLKFQYRKKVNFLINSKLILQYVETGVSKSFTEMQKQFMEQTSDLVQGYKL